MNLEEWRLAQSQGEKILLPSGLEVIVGDIHILDLVVQGKIPQALVPILKAQMAGKAATVELDQVPVYVEMAGIVAMACIKEPQGLTIDELPTGDKLFLYERATGKSQKLQPFRQPAAQSVEFAQPSNGLRPKTERAHRAKRR